MKTIRFFTLIVSLFFCVSLNAFEAKLVAEGVVLTDCQVTGRQATLTLSDKSSWGCRLLKKKEQTWMEWLMRIEPKQEFPPEFYFDYDAWNVGDAMHVYQMDRPPFLAYPYLIKNTVTGGAAFARFLPIIGLYSPTREMVDATLQRAPAVEGKIKTIHPYLTYGVIALEDNSLWKVFPLIHIPPGESQWRYGKEIQEPLEEFVFNLTDWVVGQELKFYQCKYIHLGVMGKYFAKSSERFYLLQNSVTGDLSSVCPISSEELSYLQAEYRLLHQATVHGMEVEDITPDLAKQFGYVSDTEGVIITHVNEQSPAAKCGICPGFLLLAYNDHKVSTLNELREEMSKETERKSPLLLCRHGDLTRFYSLSLD